ncbi:MAG: cupin domain-containing protein [Anaerolineae bacterium]|nr:cupin domain-containing protein [Anaerolineae bacterium]
MRLLKADPAAAKGWYAGPWNSDLTLSVGYANAGIDEPHLHARLTEIYLVARGTACIRVEAQTIDLAPGDMLVVEPGEAHTFLESSPGYFHFVIHTGEAAHPDKVMVARVRLGL